MYFAFDPPLPNSIDEIAEELLAAATNSVLPLNFFAVIDGAFNERFFDDNRRLALQYFSLYENTQLSALGKASPYLLQGPHDPSSLTGWLHKLVDACGPAPMWSVLASPCKTGELAEHFRPYLIGRTEDGMEWPIRWADTRVLPHFIQALPKDIRTSLLRVVVVWGATSRDGAACFWYEERLDVPPPRFDKLPLSDAMFARLIDVAEADAVVAKIDELQPAMLRARQPSDCHRLVTRQLAIADQFNMQQARVRQHFSMLAFMLREEFVYDTEMRRLLGRLRDGANYDTEISALSDNFWDRVANAATS